MHLWKKYSWIFWFVCSCYILSGEGEKERKAGQCDSLVALVSVASYDSVQSEACRGKAMCCSLLLLHPELSFPLCDHPQNGLRGTLLLTSPSLWRWDRFRGLGRAGQVLKEVDRSSPKKLPCVHNGAQPSGWIIIWVSCSWLHLDYCFFFDRTKRCHLKLSLQCHKAFTSSLKHLRWSFTVPLVACKE
jgi:hypothetical protein